MTTALLDPDTALARILAVSELLPAEQVDTTAALGRVTAEQVTSPAALPPFDNSAMDGFALGGMFDELPAGSEYPVEGEQAAGDGRQMAARGAWEIMTGARLPEGLDRVIPVEQTETLQAPPRVRLLVRVARGQNIRQAGSDVASGETVLAAGMLLAPQHLMLLTALGVPSVRVAARPRVAIISTGRELVDDPAQELESGQIRNSNGPFLAACLPRAGAELVHAETVGDQVEAFVAAFERARAAGAQVVLSTGAVSMGRYDFVPKALVQLHAEVLFHKIAIRPGKPLLCARLADDILFFGLPGNPIAAAVGLRFFVEPALRAMMGLPGEKPMRVPLAENFAKKPPLRFHLKARMTCNAEGCLQVAVLPGQESFRIRSLANANAWAVVPLDATELKAGTMVDVVGLGHLERPMLAGENCA